MRHRRLSWLHEASTELPHLLNELLPHPSLQVPGGFAAAESLDGGKRQAFERTSLVTDGIREAYFEEQGSYALVGCSAMPTAPVAFMFADASCSIQSLRHSRPHA